MNAAEKVGLNSVVEQVHCPTLVGITRPETGGTFGQKFPVINKLLDLQIFNHKHCSVEYNIH
jgi:hypothetical protein